MVTEYYTSISQRVALRKGSNVYYLHGDHLGSVSLITDSTGNKVAESRYLPFGEERWRADTAQTNLGFTGQRAERSFGLLDFNARFYSPKLGRFLSADIIVPNSINPGAWDRYAGMMNNPIRFIDPSGHSPNMVCADFVRCVNDLRTGGQPPTLVIFTGDESWTGIEVNTISIAVNDVAEAYAVEINASRTRTWNRMTLAGEDPGNLSLVSPTQALYMVHGGPINFERSKETGTDGAWGYTLSSTHIRIYSNASAKQVAANPRFIVHELGHAFENATIVTK